MRKAVALLAVASLLTGAAGAAEAAAKKQHAVNMSALVTQLGTATSGTVTFVGITSGTPLRAGTVRADVTVNGTAASGTVAFFNGLGSFRGTVSVNATAQPDGSVVYNGTGRVTGGTGRYKSASAGSLTVTGTQAAGDNIIALKVTGRVRY